MPRKIKYSAEEVLNIIKENGFEVLSNYEYKNNSTLIDFKDSENFYYRMDFEHFKNSIINYKCIPLKFNACNFHAKRNINLWLKRNNKSFYLISDVGKNSRSKIWFHCIVCNNDFDNCWNTVYAGTCCPICSGRRTSDKNSLIKRFPGIEEEWDFSKNYEIDINNISYGSNKKVWWNCKRCKNNYQEVVSRKVAAIYGCPKCNRNNVTDINCFGILYPELAKEWDYDKNIGKNPNDFSFGTHEKVWWICPICHSSYDCRISNRVHHRGCPICNLSGRCQEIYKFLVNNNFDFECEYWFDDLRSDLGKVLKYDFALFSEDRRIIYLIEYDSDQHTRFIPSWHGTIENFEYRCSLDKRKDDYAKDNNIPLLRIPFTDGNIEETLSNHLLVNC